MNKKVLVTGGSGLVGYALQHIQKDYSNYNFIFLSSQDCNLTDYFKTYRLFSDYKPDFVIHLAAHVGGLFRNMKEKVEMYEKNVLINLNVIQCCHVFNVKKVISCLSTCIFPDQVSYPINEEMLHDGPPHHSNDAYAYSKRMLELHSRIYNQQEKHKFICVIPTNIYGPNDNFSLQNGHVIPALIHKCYLSKKNKTNFVVKGSGRPLRQFIYSLDLAKLMMWTLEQYNEVKPIILSVNPEDEISIEKIANMIAQKFNYQDMLEFDTSFADGQYQKTADNSRLKKLNPNFNFVNIKDGLQNTIDWFQQNYSCCRK